MALSYVLQLQGRQTEALDQLNQLAEQRPDSAVVFAMRAALERDMKQYEASLYDWQQASRLEPHNVDYVVSQVDVCLLLGRKKEARRLLDAAVKSGVPRGVLLSWYEKCKRK
jgi:predicted Zn-dependent protease